MKDPIYDLTFQLEETYWWYVGRRRIILDAVHSALNTRSTNSPPRILEYGCGTGITLASLSPTAEVFGMDASPIALSYCRQRGITNLHLVDPQQPIDPVNPFGDPYDVVLLLDVLEHIADEVSILETIRCWLKPGGTLIATVPAYSFLWSGEDTVSNHLRRYTRSRLREVLQKAGLPIRRTTYFNGFLFPLQAGIIFWNRFFRPSAIMESNLRPLAKPMNSLLTSILSSERVLLKLCNLPFGGSILCVAQSDELNS